MRLAPDEDCHVETAHCLRRTPTSRRWPDRCAASSPRSTTNPPMSRCSTCSPGPPATPTSSRCAPSLGQSRLTADSPADRPVPRRKGASATSTRQAEWCAGHPKPTTRPLSLGDLVAHSGRRQRSERGGDERVHHRRAPVRRPRHPAPLAGRCRHAGPHAGRQALSPYRAEADRPTPWRCCASPRVAAAASAGLAPAFILDRLRVGSTPTPKASTRPIGAVTSCSSVNGAGGVGTLAAVSRSPARAGTRLIGITAPATSSSRDLPQPLIGRAQHGRGIGPQQRIGHRDGHPAAAIEGADRSG